jgi:DNA-binding protein HU-beta
MTKSDIVNEISTLTGVQKTDVSVCVEAFMKVVKDAMCKEENVYLRGFGTFVVKRRAQKVGRNITKKTSVIVPAHNFPGFKPAKSFQQRMKGEEITAED